MLILWQQDSGKLHTSVVRQEVVPVSFTFRFVHVLVGRSIFFNFQHTSFHETHEKKSIKTPTKMLNYLFKSGRERVWRKHKLWEMKSPSDKGMRHDRETEWQERGGGGNHTHVTDWVSMGPLCALAGACHLSRWVRVWMVTERCNGGDMSVDWVPERFQLLVMTNSYQVMAERLARFPQHKEKGHVWSL